MADKLAILKSRLESDLKREAAKHGEVIDTHDQEGVAVGLMLALYELDHLDQPWLRCDVDG
ncbi:MAG: hypothetical protein SOH70_03950 [Lentilactobacillus sunkii]|jgi:hypothetical protein|uniref:hypothetical protein n=1 Tax=Lentilactobacillus sunkii TaxID=481719 RepID=UPI002F35B48B